MYTYLFDASAAVELYMGSSRIGKALEFILAQKRVHRQAVLLIPDICIAEVFNALARKRYKEQKLTADQYIQCLREFRKDVHWGRTLYPYNLSRYHIVAADTIIAVEQNLPSLDECDHLSTFDILVIAMACELAYCGRVEETFLVTRDRRIKQVLDALKKTTTDQLKDWLAMIDLDYPLNRWSPPSCLLLQDLKRGELRPVPGQPEFNR